MLKNGYSKLKTMPAVKQQVTTKNPLQPIATKVISSTPGRLRLRVAHPHRQPATMQSLADNLKASPNINQVRINLQHGSITIHHDTEDSNVENLCATLRDLGIIFSDMLEGKSEAASQVATAVVDLNKRVKQSTKGMVDLRFLFPLGLATLSLRQLVARGWQLEMIPWYVLAWYAFDSFLKLNSQNQQQSTGE